MNFNDYRKILSLFLMSNYNRIYLSMIRLWTTKTFFFMFFDRFFWQQCTLPIYLKDHYQKKKNTK